MVSKELQAALDAAAAAAEVFRALYGRPLELDTISVLARNGPLPHVVRAVSGGALI
jgi:hypothetical protein